MPQTVLNQTNLKQASTNKTGVIGPSFKEKTPQNFSVAKFTRSKPTSFRSHPGMVSLARAGFKHRESLKKVSEQVDSDIKKLNQDIQLENREFEVSALMSRVNNMLIEVSRLLEWK